MSNQVNYVKEQTSTHRYGVSAQFIPGHPERLWYKSKRAAVAAAKEVNTRPWNRNSNRAGLVLPSGEITRSY